MISKKFKQCAATGCTRPVFSHGYCSLNIHQALRVDSDWIRKQKKKEEKPVKVYVIPKEAKRRASQNAAYRKRVKAWKLEPENCRCRFPGCSRKTQHCHHGRGKIEDLLLDERFWIPMCEEHHRIVEENPTMAKEMELSFDRLS